MVTLNEIINTANLIFIVLFFIVLYLIVIIIPFVVSKSINYFEHYFLERRFFQAIVNCLNNNRLRTLEELEILYVNIFPSERSEYQNKWTLDREIQSFISKLMVKDKDLFSEDIENLALIQWMNNMERFREENNQFVPFHNMQRGEKNLFKDLIILLNHESTDKSAIRAKIFEIGRVIDNKNYELRKNNLITWVTAFISIVSIILAVFQFFI